MSKEQLFLKWIEMIECGAVEGNNLKYASLEYRPALRAAFYSGIEAQLIVVPS